MSKVDGRIFLLHVGIVGVIFAAAAGPAQIANAYPTSWVTAPESSGAAPDAHIPTSQTTGYRGAPSVDQPLNEGSKAAGAANAPGALRPRTGEIRLDGVIREFHRDEGTIAADIFFVTLPGGQTFQLEPPHRKTIALQTATLVGPFFPGSDPVQLSDLGPSTLLSAVGVQLGTGQVLPARLVAIRPPEATVVRGGDPPADPRPFRGTRPMIWICGDSLAEDPGEILVRMIKETGAADAALTFKISSGLAEPSFFNWPAHFQEGLARWNPDTVVVILGTNDAQGFEAGSQSLVFGTEEWQVGYGRRVAAAMERLVQHDREVLWVGTPVVGRATLNVRLPVINKVIWQQAASHPGVTYLDSWPLFSTSTGAYAQSLPGTGRLRTNDGIHFARAGAVRLARALFDQLDRRWGLTASRSPSRQPGGAPAAQQPGESVQP